MKFKAGDKVTHESGRKYEVVGICKTKDLSYNAWVRSYLYGSMVNGELFARPIQDFEIKFRRTEE